MTKDEPDYNLLFKLMKSHTVQYIKHTQEYLMVKNLFEKIIVWVKQFAEVCYQDDTSIFKSDFD